MTKEPKLEDFPELLNWNFSVELLDSEQRCSWPLSDGKFPKKAKGVQGLQLLQDLSDLDRLYSGLDEFAMAKISVQCEKYNLPDTLYIQLGQGKFSNNNGSIGEVLLGVLTSIEDHAIIDLQKNNTHSKTYYYDCIDRKIGDRKLYDLIAMHMNRKQEYTRFAFELHQKEKLAKSAGFLVSKTQNMALVKVDLSEESFGYSQELSDETYEKKIHLFSKALGALSGQMAVAGNRVCTYILPKENLMFVDQAVEEIFGYFDNQKDHLKKYTDLHSYQRQEQQTDRLGAMVFADTLRKAKIISNNQNKLNKLEEQSVTRKM